MTQTIETAQPTDPEGSIFLPKSKNVEQFLALEGDPVALVAAIMAEGQLGVEQKLDRLRFSLLQARGMKEIDRDMGDEEFAVELEKRGLFYEAVQGGLELLASDRSI